MLSPIPPRPQPPGERELREASAFLEHVIETSPMVILRRRPSDLGVIFISANAERLLGYTAEELLETPESYNARVHPDDVGQLLTEYARAMAARESQLETEYRFLRRDGTYRWLYGVARIKYGEDGQPQEILGYGLDITARKQAILEARRAKEEAELANRAKSEFLSRMSHELRTPLNAILGFSQLLESDPLPPESRDSVAHIRRAGSHLLSMINEVLDIARIESGRLQLTLGPVFVGDVLAEAVELIRPLTLARAVRLEADFARDARFVRADRQRLGQILVNLLSNAVKYNRQGGQVRVVTRLQPGGRIRIAVSDTGPGIAPELMARLFTPFDRLGAEQTGVEGTGIGLSLCKRLTEAMDGAIGVESVVGQGSTFWVEFAAATVPAPANSKAT